MQWRKLLTYCLGVKINNEALMSLNYPNWLLRMKLDRLYNFGTIAKCQISTPRSDK